MVGDGGPGDGAQCSGTAFTEDDKRRFLNISETTLFNVVA